MSVILSIQQMVALEKEAVAGEVDAWELMQEAGQKMVEAIRQSFPKAGRCQVYAGKGNNGGDALVVAAGLRAAGWEVQLILAYPAEQLSDLARRALDDWEKVQAKPRPPAPRLYKRNQPILVIDGLLGNGVHGEVRPPLRELIEAIRLERERGAIVYALDLPSGLGAADGNAVVADHTLTVGFAKSELLADEAMAFVGRLSVLPLTPLMEQRNHPASAERLITAASIGHLLPPQSFDRHKGQNGRIALVAGSVGTAGAAVLATTGALRAGAGLVSLYYPPELHPQLASMLPPEIMARPWDNLADLAAGKIDVLAVGPGLSPEHAKAVLPLLQAAVDAGLTMVLDAGALTILAQKRALLAQLGSNVLLTPHPGEMERLFPKNQRSRRDWARDFCNAHRCTLLLKGSRTIVAAEGEALAYNSTGHPGMATGGMGDTLTGVLAALLGKKLTPYNAACVGAWVCGRAAEIAILEDGQSQESLIPTDLDRCLGRAFADLRRRIY